MELYVQRLCLVAIADNFVLPFSGVLDWKMFVTHVLKINIPDLKTILEAVSSENYFRMQGRVKKDRHHFLLNQPLQR